MAASGTAMLAVALLAGCGVAADPVATRAAGSGTPGTFAAPGSPLGGGTTSSEVLPPDSEGNPACAAYDGWRPGPDGAGITVTYWYEGADPVTVVVRHGSDPDLTQTVDNDVYQRYHDFEFLDVDPGTVTEVLVTTGEARCFVRAVPA